MEWDDDCRVGTGEQLQLDVGIGEQLELLEVGVREVVAGVAGIQVFCNSAGKDEEEEEEEEEGEQEEQEEELHVT